MKNAKGAKVTNINRHGSVFVPSEYPVPKSENPELYRLLESVQPENPHE